MVCIAVLPRRQLQNQRKKNWRGRKKLTCPPPPEADKPGGK